MVRTALVVPVWDDDDLDASRTVLHAEGSLPDKPVFSADPLNVFMVAEAGDQGNKNTGTGVFYAQP